ncbi:MAG: hypothetical protein ACXWE9_05650 [Methylobacter sp.]
MRFFKAAATLISPGKSQFAKQLISKRRAMSENSLLAGIAVAGSPEYAFRRIGLESAEFLVAPEATIANLLEKIYKPHVIGFYKESFFHARSDEERSKCLQSLCGHVDYLFTGKPDAAVRLPEFTALKDYVRYVVMREHPTSGLSRSTLTDEFLEYAIAEAEHVFRN